MTTNFPTSVDNFPDPLATDRLDNPPHDVLHTDINSAVEALQAKVGADSSAVTTSHDYKITQLEAKSPTITLAGGASGSVTLTNLGSGTLTVTVADDSHNHTIANVDNLQTTLDGKAASSHTHSYAATSHTHSYLPLTGGTVTGNLTAQGNMYIGKDGGGDSNAYFYDDGNNTWRTLQWDDSFNDWRVEDNNGTMRTLYHSGNIPSYAASSHTHSYLPTSGGTMTGELQVNARLDVGNGTNGNHEIRIYKADNNVSDHIQFYNGTTRMGEIGCEDTSWLRINQETAKNIYTPRYIRADAGFFVDGSTWGINGSGNGRFATNVGIGTSSPAHELEVVAANHPEIRIRSSKNGSWSAGEAFGTLAFYSNDASGGGAGNRATIVAAARDTYGYETDLIISEVTGGTWRECIRIGAWGFTGFNITSPSERIHASGNILVTGTGYKPGGGSWASSSDERLKKDISPYTEGLATLCLLNPVSYTWDCDEIDSSGTKQVGVLAQEVEQVWSPWVQTIDNRTFVRSSDGQEFSNTKAISFGNDFNVIVIAAIKELAERIEALEVL